MNPDQLTTPHRHNGIDNYRIDPVDLLGFPILETIPDYPEIEGTQVFVTVGGQTYIYAMINKVWTRMATASIFLSNTDTLNFGAILPNTSADLTMTLTGAVDTNTISLGVEDIVYSTGTNTGDLIFSAWVSAADTVTIRASNISAVNTATPAAGIFKVSTIQF